VCDLALMLAWVGMVYLPLHQPEESMATIRDHTTAVATSKLHPHMLPVSILRYAKVIQYSATPLLIFVSIRSKPAHTSSCFPCLCCIPWFRCTPAEYIHRLFKLRMVKWPSLIKIWHGVEFWLMNLGIFTIINNGVNLWWRWIKARIILKILP
jgi:hypothetical protein